MRDEYILALQQHRDANPGPVVNKEDLILQLLSELHTDVSQLVKDNADAISRITTLERLNTRAHLTQMALIGFSGCIIGSVFGPAISSYVSAVIFHIPAQHTLHSTNTIRSLVASIDSLIINTL